MTLEQQIADLIAENAALKDQAIKQSASRMSMKVSEKGGVSVYGLGRFPVTLYADPWLRLLSKADEIRDFIKDNQSVLSYKKPAKA